MCSDAEEYGNAEAKTDDEDACEEFGAILGDRCVGLPLVSGKAKD